MSRDILNIGGEPIFDDRIVKIETHTYNPYANTTFGYSDEIRIPIQHQDLYTLPCESFLYVEGKFSTTKRDGNTSEEQPPKLSNNCVAFMFDEIRYELDGVEIDRSRNVGITSTIKNFISLTTGRSITLENAGWDGTMQLFRTPLSENFNFCVPLNTLLGFCEDYKRIVINARHKLILIRARNDNNCVVTHESTEPNITLLKIQWRMPHVVLNDVNKLSLLRTLEGGRYLSVCFRSWDLYEFPLLQSTTKHSWAVKTTSQLEKPRYVIFALQTGKRNVTSKNGSQFDICNLTNVKLFLNSDFYPYDDMNLDFEHKKYAILYDMYVKFQKTYYGYNNRDPMLSIGEFLVHGPFVVIDCSRQNESIKSATVDIRTEFECMENIPLNTTAYCLIIHDRVIEYNPLTNVIRKIV
ncbi:hypothetical protein ALC57_14532 [Trachymyrmex cornetzi]|uniref:Double jelly roll-like domain-containing protein n=1 Tax=Trachymyrmex cornetzi TaxID=471704 RepID=A0A151IY88_9HYME|nr:hypothetical protein ALC57_14532 [Trachymyrmex cornetzi]